MSKLTKREYKNMAKRPGQKGHGFPQRRKHKDSEWDPKPEVIAEKGNGMPQTRFESGKAQPEAVRPEAEAAAVEAEEVLTDLGEQEKEAIQENAEAAKVDDLPKVAKVAKKKKAKKKVTKKVYEKPLSHKGSTIDKSGVK